MSVQRLRGIVGASVIWAILWLPLGIVAGVLQYLDTPPYDLISHVHAAGDRPPALPIIARMTSAYVVWGAVVGVVFAFVLVSAERKRSVEELSSRRIAVWGALAGVCLPVFLYIMQLVEWGQLELGWRTVLTLVVTPAFGATCAVGMLRLARRAGSLTRA